jgi:hypothetical protein
VYSATVNAMLEIGLFPNIPYICGHIARFVFKTHAVQLAGSPIAA